MPLKCLKGDEEIFAFNFDDAGWASLREENAKHKFLKMPCCGVNAVLRTSKLGTKHFAHARRGTCTSAPETAEHLLAKATISAGVRTAGWIAMTEQEGVTPNGEVWIADVMAKKGAISVAFEVQWSRQKEEETRERQQRYAASGVRALWLFRQHDFPIGKDVPCFRLVMDASGKSYTVLMPSPVYHPEWVKRTEVDDARNWQQSIGLQEFIHGALSGRLKFAPAINRTVPFSVEHEDMKCWRCKRHTRIVTGFVFSVSKVLPNCPDIKTSLYSFDTNDGIRYLLKLLPRSLLRKFGIGALKRRYSKTEGRAYLSNGCVHCDALQGRFFEYEADWQTCDEFSVDAYLGEDLIRSLEIDDRYLNTWWFDEEGVLSGNEVRT